MNLSLAISRLRSVIWHLDAAYGLARWQAVVVPSGTAEISRLQSRDQSVYLRL
jgi:hypothetical protein